MWERIYFSSEIVDDLRMVMTRTLSKWSWNNLFLTLPKDWSFHSICYIIFHFLQHAQVTGAPINDTCFLTYLGPSSR